MAMQAEVAPAATSCQDVPVGFLRRSSISDGVNEGTVCIGYAVTAQ
jgi:hypothetical protein